MPSFRVVALGANGERRETTIPGADTGADAMRRFLGWKSSREDPNLHICYFIPEDEPLPDDVRRVIEATWRVLYAAGQRRQR